MSAVDQGLRPEAGPLPWRWECQKFRVLAALVVFVRPGRMAGTVAAQAGPPRVRRPGFAPERRQGGAARKGGVRRWPLT